MSDTPQEEDYPVGSKITCDEYALVLLMRRSGLLRPLHYIQNIPLTNQELMHVLECKACTLGRSGGNYSLDQMAMALPWSLLWTYPQQLDRREQLRCQSARHVHQSD